MIVVLFHIGSALMSAAVAIVLVIKLMRYNALFRIDERLGMGLVGAMSILRIGPILAAPETTPFSDWSTFLMALGIFLMIYGRLRRLNRHARANTLAADAAEMHLRARGKI